MGSDGALVFSIKCHLLKSSAASHIQPASHCADDFLNQENWCTEMLVGKLLRAEAELSLPQHSWIACGSFLICLALVNCLFLDSLGSRRLPWLLPDLMNIFRFLISKTMHPQCLSHAAARHKGDNIHQQATYLEGRAGAPQR